MIIGIGIDNVEIERIQEKVLHKPAFIAHVFSAEEQRYCEQKTNRFESYAARFAAKEAFLKAAGTGLLFNTELNQITILNNAQGKPFIQLSDTLKEQLLNQFEVPFIIHVSLSHTGSQACAVVLIETAS